MLLSLLVPEIYSCHVQTFSSEQGAARPYALLEHIFLIILRGWLPSVVFQDTLLSMSTPAANVRQRSGKQTKTAQDLNGSANGAAVVNEKIEQIRVAGQEAITKDWDYKLALAVITALAFITRFYGITHPNQVVFDEVCMSR